MDGEEAVMTITVRAASRLHFGLLNVPAPGQIAERSFGGLGLMIDRPGLTVSASDSKDWFFTGSLAERAQTIVERIGHPSPVAIVANGPSEHVGLGVGTALSMALVVALAGLKDERLSVPQIVECSGRGERSGIGVHGFFTGGFIVDRGRRTGQVMADCETYSLPPDWRVVLVRPSVSGVWHGETERAAFARVRSLEEAHRTTARLMAILDGEILPALQQSEFRSFATAIGNYNRLAGEPFAGDQGGVYSNCVIEEWIDRLQSLGLTGVGQSSWGPTVFAFVETQNQADWLVTRIRNDGNTFDDVTIAAMAEPARTRINC
jgi:beta-ribofuranosylaminobenzene 5'-phosphate synthase